MSDPSLSLLAAGALTRRLRRECPWDREQDERSIVPHTLEEAYELADAAYDGDDAKLLDGGERWGPPRVATICREAPVL
jgi:hypothetical protein